MSDRDPGGGAGVSAGLAPKIGVWTAAAVVVGNMVGTGVFTSLGFQVGGLHSGFTLLLLWGLGGVLAFCGATCYAELSAVFPRSGGEYNLLGRVFHPAAGFVSGWVSTTVGFAAPVALAALASGQYLAGAAGAGGTGWPVAIALAIVAAVTGVHLWKVSAGGRLQVVFTVLKVGVLAVLAAAGLALGPGAPPGFFAPTAEAAALVATPAFAVSLVYVMYAYTGWNAATYIVDEVKDPARGVSRALLGGTALVTVLYLLANAGFLRAAGAEELDGVVEVGLVAARELSGDGGALAVGALVGAGLVSSIGAMLWAGSRVACVMGEDYRGRGLGWLARRGGGGVPRVALLVQSGIAAALLLTATFEQVLVAVQVVLLASSGATVAGVLWTRWRHPDLPRPVKAWGYPATPLLFLGVTAWMLWHASVQNPAESLAGLAVPASGLAVYAFMARGRESARRGDPGTVG